MKKYLVIAGYLFVSIVSIIMAIRVEGSIYKILLIASTIISLVLAVTRTSTTKKMSERIKTLEENQLSVSVDENEECMEFDQGHKKGGQPLSD